MTFGAAAQVGNKNLNIDMMGFEGYAHQISGGYSQGRSVWGGRGAKVLRYLFPLRYLWSVVSLHEAVVIDRMWVGPVCVCAVRACNPQSVENPTAGFLKQKTSTSSAQQKDNRPHTTDTYKLLQHSCSDY